MPRTRRAAVWAIVASATMALGTLAQAPATAGPDNGHGQGGNHADRGHHYGNDVQPVPDAIREGKKQPFAQKASRKAQHQAKQQKTVKGVKVGDTREWLADDDFKGSIYLKPYTLRGIGDHIEVWVANHRAFPDHNGVPDCRNGLGLTDVTDAQVRSFIDEFDHNIYPKESASFSVPPSQDGSDALTSALGVPKNYYKTNKKGADDIVVLVDNVRDANYYDPASPDGQTYIAGFFYSLFNLYTDRNIMTIDAYDWLHRTGANPPNNSSDPAYQSCPYASGAPRPRLYEGTFAHEYQHLLEYYQDPDEASWVNEGLSDYAQTLVGYVDPSVPVTDPKADSHIACFSGFLADQGYGGPENSLTAWGDQGGPEILCDYGAAYSFMQYLFGHYGGESFMSALHREPGNGLTGLQNVLDATGSTDSAMDVVHKWAATAALDNVVDNGATLSGGDPAAYSEDTLGMAINWDATYGDINHDGTSDDPGNEAYSTPGAPPNGSDYVRLRDADGNYVDAGALNDLSFDAAGSFAPTPKQWTVDTTPPDATASDTECGNVPDGTGPAAFYSGCGADLDRAIAKTVTVPASGATLTFDGLWDIEAGYDFGFVQVWNDTKGAWESIGCTDTTSATASDASSAVQENVPGFTGDSQGWKQESCDLSAYANQTVDLAFRYVTDPGVNEAGFWVRNIAVGDQQVAAGDSLDGWKSGTEAHHTPVSGFTVQLVAYDANGAAAWVGQLPVSRGADGDFHGSLSDAALHAVVGSSAQTVAALVMQDDPSEGVTKYAPYTLTANGVEQPGG